MTIPPGLGGGGAGSNGGSSQPMLQQQQQAPQQEMYNNFQQASQNTTQQQQQQQQQYDQSYYHEQQRQQYKQNEHQQQQVRCHEGGIGCCFKNIDMFCGSFSLIRFFFASLNPSIPHNIYCPLLFFCLFISLFSNMYSSRSH